MVWERTSSLTWEDMSGDWDSQLMRWDDAITIEEWEEIILGRSDGHTLKVDDTTTDDDGSAVAGKHETPDFIGTGLEFKDRWLQLDVWAKGPGTLKLYYSTDYGESWTGFPSTSNNLSLTEEYQKFRCYFDVVAERIRFKLVEETSGGTFYLRHIMPFYVSREEARG